MTLRKICLAALLLAATACGNQSTESASGEAAERLPAREKAKLTKNAGYDALMAMVDSKYLKCGGIYSTKEVEVNSQGKIWRIDWVQMSGFDPAVEEIEVSSADKLNGITFRGIATFGNDVAWRAMWNYSNDSWQPWEADISFWKDPTAIGVIPQPPVWIIVRQNDVWALSNPVPRQPAPIKDNQVRPSSCDEVPAEVAKSL